MKFLKKLTILFLVCFVIIQFFQPDKNTGDLASLNYFIKETEPSESVQIALKNACYDCHSNYTEYPWYSNITPVNYWMSNHIFQGKVGLNFSDWENYSVAKRMFKMEEIAEYMEKRWMPLNSYTYGHPEAALTDDQIESLINWAKGIRSTYDLYKK